MTQEDKQLLLKDLCTRLPYGVIVLREYDKENPYLGDCLVQSRLTPEIYELFSIGIIISCKPYLRPMSSMTKEEADEFEKISNELLENGENTEIWDTVVDWLNAHYFDHRGLIPMGLALEATEDMYKEK